MREKQEKKQTLKGLDPFYLSAAFPPLQQLPLPPFFCLSPQSDTFDCTVCYLHIKLIDDNYCHGKFCIQRDKILLVSGEMLICTTLPHTCRKKDSEGTKGAQGKKSSHTSQVPPFWDVYGMVDVPILCYMPILLKPRSASEMAVCSIFQEVFSLITAIYQKPRYLLQQVQSMPLLILLKEKDNASMKLIHHPFCIRSFQE